MIAFEYFVGNLEGLERHADKIGDDIVEIWEDETLSSRTQLARRLIEVAAELNMVAVALMRAK